MHLLTSVVIFRLYGMMEYWLKMHNFSVWIKVFSIHGLFTCLPRRLMSWLYQERLEKIIIPKLKLYNMNATKIENTKKYSGLFHFTF
jgi:hypothetical protein